LYDFVISVIDDFPDSISLLERIRYEYLSCDTIQRFVSWSFDHFDENCVTFGLWRSLSVRLLLSVSPSQPNSRLAIPTFSPGADGSLDGIISHLTRKHGGNVHDRGIVDISAKSTYSSSSSYSAKNAADSGITNYFHSDSSAGQWLCYDFKNLRVKPTHYSIHAYFGGYYLRSWVFEGSIDGSSWIVFDEQKDNSTMNSSHLIGTFAAGQSRECRFIRLRQTGKNASGDDYLYLCGFEIFGQLIEMEQRESQ
jgi:hypothetical protein